ncbi:helix-turn-helix domain-containing protein [Rhodococcus erythropolis]|uniref:helix-turn-helix domain-containing protein n=1 Tax=Rhodococcus erythropolis TaxID=1833 RepID=UPI0037BC57EF
MASVLLRSVDDREPSMSQAVLVEILVSSTTDRADRARALRILGYGGHLRVLAFVGSPADVEVVIAQLKTAGQRVHWLRMGDTWAITIDGDIPDSLGVPIGSYLAVGTRTPGLSAPKSWQTACLALLFTLPSSHDTGPYRREEAVAADVDRIGCFALLAQHIPRRSIADADEIRALDRLADEPGGAEMLRTLEAVAATESIRRAGSTIHMHHNTVRNRVERAEEALKFSVTEPYGRVRLMMSLILRRLRDAPVVPLGYPARED